MEGHSTNPKYLNDTQGAALRGGSFNFAQMKKASPQTDLITAGVGASSAPIIKKSQLEDWLSYLLEWASKWNGMGKF